MINLEMIISTCVDNVREEVRHWMFEGEGYDVDEEMEREEREEGVTHVKSEVQGNVLESKPKKLALILYYCNTGTKGERGRNMSKASMGMYVGYDTLMQEQGTK